MIKIRLSEQDIELHGNGMLWIENIRLLAASDIHFEKGSFFHQFGSMLPPYDSQETLRKLETAIAHFEPDIFIALGDSFHDVDAVKRMDALQKMALNRLVESVEQFLWITGNHDPHISEEIKGQRLEEYSSGDLWFRHEHHADGLAEISGHYHPKAQLHIKGTRIAAPCFVRRHNKLIMPAFGSYTGGLNIDSEAFLQVMPPAERDIFLTYKERIYAL